MRPRTNWKSVSLAAGYATSICLTPHFTSCLKNVVFCSMVIGLARAWFPSRRSVESHMGAFVNVLDGHCRSFRFIGVYGLYFRMGSSLGQTNQILGRWIPVTGRLTAWACWEQDKVEPVKGKLLIIPFISGQHFYVTSMTRFLGVNKVCIRPS